MQDHVCQKQCRYHMSKEKMQCIGDEILPSYVGIIVNHYKDPDPY